MYHSRCLKTFWLECVYGKLYFSMYKKNLELFVTFCFHLVIDYLYHIKTPRVMVTKKGGDHLNNLYNKTAAREEE